MYTDGSVSFAHGYASINGDGELTVNKILIGNHYIDIDGSVSFAEGNFTIDGNGNVSGTSFANTTTLNNGTIESVTLNKEQLVIGSDQQTNWVVGNENTSAYLTTRYIGVSYDKNFGDTNLTATISPNGLSFGGHNLSQVTTSTFNQDKISNELSDQNDPTITDKWEIGYNGIDIMNGGSHQFIVDSFGNIKGKSITINTLSTNDINALTPSVGIVVYNSTLHTLCFYNGTSWQKVTSTNM